MKGLRKRQLLFLAANLLVLLILFLSLRFYDNRLRPVPQAYGRPVVEMEKIFPADNPYFPLFDRMNLFARYRGTRAVGTENPGKMVILVPRAGYEGEFHFSRLMNGAYERNIGLVIMDFSDVRHFIPLDGGTGLLENRERMILFLETMISYMEQYGYGDFSLLYLGMDPPAYIEEGLSRFNPGRADREGAPSDESALIDAILGAAR